MKTIVKILFIILIAELLSQCKKDTIPYVTITDDNFLTALIKRGVDKNSDSIISNDEAAEITFLDVGSHNISDLKGIEAFVNLDTLDCSDNQLTSLDLSNNTALILLSCSDNQLTSLDVSNNTSLTYLEVSIRCNASFLSCRG
jgi:Leucine-rich repeat (LRR) protein